MVTISLRPLSEPLPLLTSQLKPRIYLKRYQILRYYPFLNILQKFLRRAKLHTFRVGLTTEGFEPSQ